VKINIGQTVDQSLTFIDNYTFKTVPPKIPAAIVAPVVVPGEADFDFPHKFGKA
jgi:hypothetical protein